MDIKIDGGKQAGVETILCPKQNHNDLEIIQLEKPEILESITKGNFKPLMNWLIMNVHSKGCSLSTKDLITIATGEPLNAKFFKSHLQNRYLN